MVPQRATTVRRKAPGWARRELVPRQPRAPASRPPGRRPRPLAPEPTTRECVLRAAVRLFTERGYGLTSMREIAERAGVTKPVIYYYFKSKQELYAGLLRQVLEETEAVFAAEVERAGSAAARLRALIKAHVRICREEPDLTRFVYDVFSSPGALPLGFDYYAAGHRIMARIENLIRDGQRRGEFRRVDPACAVMMLTGAINLYVAAHLNHNPPALTPRTADNLTAILLRGLSAEKRR